MVAGGLICEDRRMRHVWVLTLLSAILSFVAACAKSAPEVPTGNRLVLEVGGKQSSLREALRDMGRSVGAPRRLRPAPPAPVTLAAPVGRSSVADAPLDRGVDQAGDRAAFDAEVSPAVADQEWVIVKMEPGDANLGDVAKRHLGSSKRYLDIQRWNGIDDEQAKRLRVGHELKLKRSELK